MRFSEGCYKWRGDLSDGVAARCVYCPHPALPHGGGGCLTGRCSRAFMPDVFLMSAINGRPARYRASAVCGQTPPQPSPTGGGGGYSGSCRSGIHARRFLMSAINGRPTVAIFVGCVPQARTRFPIQIPRVRVGYAAIHPTPRIRHRVRLGAPSGDGYTAHTKARMRRTAAQSQSPLRTVRVKISAPPLSA